MILLPIETHVTWKILLNIETCHKRKWDWILQLPEKALMLQMINFSQLLESLLRFFGTFHVEHLEMANGHTIDVCPGYCPTSADQPGHHLFSKAIPEVQHSGKREKKFNLISPPLRKVVQEKMARPGWSPSNYSKSHLLQPFSAQGWLDASNCGWIGTFDALNQDTNRKLWDLSSKLDLLSVANLHNQNDEKNGTMLFQMLFWQTGLSFGRLPPPLPPYPPLCGNHLWNATSPLSQFYPLLNVGSSNIPLFLTLSWILVLNSCFRSILNLSKRCFTQFQFSCITSFYYAQNFDLKQYVKPPLNP